jgi:hypothetical protein
MIREALLYEKLTDSRVQCALCAHRCKINSGRRGLCGVRENKDGILYSLVFGTLIAEHVDPIEKKRKITIICKVRSVTPKVLTNLTRSSTIHAYGSEKGKKPLSPACRWLLMTSMPSTVCSLVYNFIKEPSGLPRRFFYLVF